MSITPKDWSKFQHYRDRKPPWIKLYRDLLDDPDFQMLPVASRALAPCLWLLASDYPKGIIPLTLEGVAFRLRMTVPDLIEALKPLISARFFSTDSDLLASCKQSALPETERETETERDISSAPRRIRLPKAGSDDPEFEEWYRAYPRREARGAAHKAYLAARKTADAATLLAAAKAAQKKYTDPKFTPMPATWLNQQRWLDEAQVVQRAFKVGGGFA